jgi:hypothetical protein
MRVELVPVDVVIVVLEGAPIPIICCCKILSTQVPGVSFIMSTSSLSLEKKLIEEDDSKSAKTIRILSTATAFFVLCSVALAIFSAIIYDKSECSLEEKRHSRTVVIGSLKQTFHQVEAYAIDFVLRSRG